jgi:tetratricopeptide (TPR) repeat protein
MNSPEQMTSEELHKSGEKYLNSHQYDQAILYLEQLVKIDPLNSGAYLDLASAYIGQEDFVGAINAASDGVEKCFDDQGFLEEIEELYKVIIDSAPDTIEAYIGLIDVYISLCDEEKATEILERGLVQFSGNPQAVEKYYSAIIPDYELKQTLYQEVRARDGVLIARNEYIQPYFTRTGAREQKLNSFFEAETIAANLENFYNEAEKYMNHEDPVYSDITEGGLIGGYLKKWEESYRWKQYISFIAHGRWDGFGAHGDNDKSGGTIDSVTGKVLTIYDIMNIHMKAL